jgi:hypothetical protein
MVSVPENVTNIGLPQNVPSSLPSVSVDLPSLPSQLPLDIPTELPSQLPLDVQQNVTRIVQTLPKDTGTTKTTVTTSNGIQLTSFSLFWLVLFLSVFK